LWLFNTREENWDIKNTSCKIIYLAESSHWRWLFHLFMFHFLQWVFLTPRKLYLNKQNLVDLISLWLFWMSGKLMILLEVLKLEWVFPHQGKTNNNHLDKTKQRFMIAEQSLAMRWHDRKKKLKMAWPWKSFHFSYNKRLQALVKERLGKTKVENVFPFENERNVFLQD